MKDLFGLLRYSKKYIGWITISLTANISQVVVGFLIPKIGELLLNEALPLLDKDLLLKYSIWMLLAAVAGLVAGLINNYYSQKVAMYSTTDLRLDLFKKIQTLSFTNIDKLKTSRLITTATNDMTRIQAFYQMLLRIVIRAPFMIVIGLFFALNSSIELSQVLLISMPVMVVMIVIIMTIAFPKFKKVQQTIDDVNKVSLETAKAPRVIKSFVSMDHENQRFQEVNENFRRINSSANRVMAFTDPLINMIFNFTLGGVIALGAYYADQGILLNAQGGPATGTIFSFTSYSMQILFGLLMFAMMMIFLSRASVSAKRIKEVFDEKTDLGNKDDAIKGVELTGAIEFDRVGFGYGTDGNRVLKDVSFTIQPGQTIGVIGSTGSGKSSLIQLIPRLYDVCEGAIKVNGINIKDLDLHDLRQQISVVTQTPTIFSGSIGTNIVQGKKGANIDDLKTASETASALEFIGQYDDYFNHITEQDGKNLSGGQKQRISLARALIKKPKILILDDSTSAVDAQTETQIIEALRELRSTTTSIVIAQKISTLKDMDKILVLNNKGYVDGFDTHEKLLETSEVYKEIAVSQLGTGGEGNE
jgi:ATP-binding cassette subfamily B protein